MTKKRQPLGLLLVDANLISHAQLEAALMMQNDYSDLLLGEILALRGWLKQETADFFVDRWPDMLKQSKQPIGQYLQSAGLIKEEQIQVILQEQQQSGLQFGVLAAYKGWVDQGTIDFFLERLKNTPVQPFSIPFYDGQNPILEDDQVWLNRLIQADLLSEAQLQLLKSDRAIYPDLSLNEILDLRGWLKPKTLEFFQSHWEQLRPDHPIGYYLEEADLLTAYQIQDLLRDQWQTGVKLGSLAVMRGWIKQETLDVFLETLAPEKRRDSPFVRKHDPVQVDPGDTTQALETPQDEIAYQSLDEFADADGVPQEIDNDDIDWI